MFGLPVNAMSFLNRRRPLKANASHSRLRNGCRYGLAVAVLFLLPVWAQAQTQIPQTQGPVRITLDEAIQMALQHNHNMLAARTTILQSQAEETTANLRPNPYLFADWEYLPLGSPSSQNPSVYSGVSFSDYLKNNTEGDIGLGYLFERGQKRQHRLKAARDITAQTRSLVADNERGLSFGVAAGFINV